jgi:hypothetical protein
VRLRHVYPVGTTLVAGQVVRHRALGSEGMYRVLEPRGSIVEMEVITAPGLLPGTHVQMCAAAARAMESVRAPARAARFEFATPRATVRRAA